MSYRDGMNFCKDCKKETKEVHDTAAGDLICSECGLVSSQHFIEETAEWRAFSDEPDSTSKIRTGGQVNPLLTDAGLYTTISSSPATNTKPTGFENVQRYSSVANPDKAVLAGFSVIHEMADRLELPTTIKVLSGACLFIACRHENMSRGVKEILTVLPPGADRNSLSKAISTVESQLPSTEYLRRFCSHLGLSNATVRAANEAVKKVEAMDIRRSPLTVAATVIYLVSSFQDKKTVEEVSKVSGVAQSTINALYSRIHPQRYQLVPQWFLQAVHAQAQ